MNLAIWTGEWQSIDKWMKKSDKMPNADRYEWTWHVAEMNRVNAMNGSLEWDRTGEKKETKNHLKAVNCLIRSVSKRCIETSASYLCNEVAFKLNTETKMIDITAWSVDSAYAPKATWMSLSII